MPAKVIATIQQLAAVCKKHEGIIFTDKDCNIINNTNEPDIEIDNTETCNNNIEITGWMTSTQKLRKWMTQTHQSYQNQLPYHKQATTQVSSQEWMAIIVIRIHKQRSNMRTPMMTKIYQLRKNRPKINTQQLMI
jgi:hypothetical protein